MSRVKAASQNALGYCRKRLSASILTHFFPIFFFFFLSLSPPPALAAPSTHPDAILLPRVPLCRVPCPVVRLRHAVAYSTHTLGVVAATVYVHIHRRFEGGKRISGPTATERKKNTPLVEKTNNGFRVPSFIDSRENAPFAGWFRSKSVNCVRRYIFIISLRWYCAAQCTKLADRNAEITSGWRKTLDPINLVLAVNDVPQRIYSPKMLLKTRNISDIFPSLSEIFIKINFTSIEVKECFTGYSVINSIG